MKLIRWIVKIILLPVACVLTLIQWIGIFLNSISGVVMGILSFLFVLTGTASLIFGLASGSEFLKTDLWAGLRVGVPEDDDHSVYHFPDPAYR